MTTESQNASTHVSKVQSRTSKRILSVTVKRLVDTDPDTSHYGEYASRPTSDQFSIDREHSLDCAINTHVIPEDHFAKSHNIDIDYAREAGGMCEDCGLSPDDCLKQPCQYGFPVCDCGERGDRECNEYRYFNPSFNYVDEHDRPRDGLSPDEIRKYVRQDYERMESLNAGQWVYIGIRAEAEVQLTGDLCQTITSGGLWGIESDSDHSYFAEVENEQLAELRKQLESMGFSKRAVSAAFRDIERTNE